MKKEKTTKKTNSNFTKTNDAVITKNSKIGKLLEFLKGISYAIIPFLILVFFQELSWTGNMMLGKDGVSLAIGLDSKIPLISEFVWIYLLTFPIAVFGFFWVASKDRKHLWNLWLTATIAFIFSGLFYLFFQTQMVKPDLNPVTISDHLLIWTWGTCKPINCFPSQHVIMALAIFLAYYNQQKTTPAWFRILNYICATLIILATVFLKQHYVVDMFGSMAIMIPTYIIVKQWKFGDFMERKIATKKAKKLNKALVENQDETQSQEDANPVLDNTDEYLGGVEQSIQDKEPTQSDISTEIIEPDPTDKE